MSSTAPHFLLLTRANSNGEGASGQWSFVLERTGDSKRIEAADHEPGVQGERLDLLAVVRGLEALEQPSHVTLVTSSNYVGRGFRNGLKIWSENGFQWERFGEQAPIKNQDLWKRIARTLVYHTVDCRIWQFGSQKSGAAVSSNTLSARSSQPPRESNASEMPLTLPSLITGPDSIAGHHERESEIRDRKRFEDFDMSLDGEETEPPVSGSGFAVGSHAARAGIVYRHYAASSSSKTNTESTSAKTNGSRISSLKKSSVVPAGAVTGENITGDVITTTAKTAGSAPAIVEPFRPSAITRLIAGQAGATGAVQSMGTLSPA